MATTGHETEAINVQGLKASLKKGGNIGIYNEAICSTAGGTAAKVTNTTPPSFTLTAGAKILVKFTYAISAENATLQVGSNTAKPIYYKGAALPADIVKAGSSLLLAYDGTNFNVVGDINIDSQYTLPTASDQTLGGVKVGTNLSIDQEGVLSATDTTYTAGSGIDITSGEISVDSTVIYTKTQADGQFIVIVNSNSEPTSSTLTYTATDGTTKSFKTGDEIRVPDQDAENGYTFYKLYALTTDGGVTTATWDKLGAGGAAPVNPNETVNISLTQIGGNSADLMGASITVTDTDTSQYSTYTWQGTIITMEIATGTNYAVSVETISGYLPCTYKSYIAGYQSERNISFQYRGNGTFIEDTSGVLYTSSSWDSSNTANAVVLITSACKVRMALTETALPIHSNYTDPLENYITAKDAASAKVDYDGEGNTNKIIQFNAAYGTNTTSYAAPYCKAFGFTYPIGQKGFLPSLGQLWTLYQNKTEVDACLTACGGTPISTSTCLWSSTFWGVYGTVQSRCLYVLRWAGTTDYEAITHDYIVRPVSTYE